MNLLSLTVLVAASMNSGGNEAKQDITYVKREDPAMQKWRENRFGLFIHWGLFAVPGGYWKGEYVDNAAEWIKSAAHIPDDEYSQLIHQFNPTEFNATAWAKMAKKLGVKYLTLIPKHHEGFCMWDSKYTDFDLASTPYKKDIIGPLSRALKAEGIDFYLYYSIIDWHNPDYRSELKTDDDVAAMGRYRQYMKNQFKEVLTKYPLIKGMWFDGQWDPAWRSHPEYGTELWTYLKQLRPNIVINNRLRVTTTGKVDQNDDGTPTGDFDSSFERKLAQGKLPPGDWEACMTVPQNQWGYNRTWKGHVKTPSEILEMLVHCTAMSGNFMLNFGPKPDGTFRSEEWGMVNEIGPWMSTHGEAIYGCSNAGMDKPSWGYVTMKPGKHGTKRYFLWVPKATETTTVEFGLDPAKIISARKLGEHRTKVSFTTETHGKTRVTLPAERDALADVIEIVAK